MTGYRHRDELQALLSPAVRAALSDPTIRCGGYADMRIQKGLADSRNS